MFRAIHAYNIKSGVHEQSFVEWLDSQLDEIVGPAAIVNEVKQAILLRKI